MDFIINKVTGTCTLGSLGVSTETLLNGAKRDDKHFIVIKPPNEIFGTEDYYFAGSVRISLTIHLSNILK